MPPSGGTARAVVHEGCRGAYGSGVGAMRGLGPSRAGARPERGWRTRAGIALVLTGAVLAGCTANEVIRQATPSPELSGPADHATVLAPVAPVPLAAATSAALYRS